MFHSSLGVFQATEGIFCGTDTAVPDELRVVVGSALAPTSTVHVRVLTAGTPNDVHDYHNPTLLAAKVTATVTDAQGEVAATVAVEQVTVASGTYAAYKLTLARSVVPTEISAVSVLSPYVAGTMATTGPSALAVSAPRIELAVARPMMTFVPWAPSAAAGVTAPSMPVGGHKLVVGSSVSLRFAFEAPEDFGAGAAASFTAMANGVGISLASATVDGTALIVDYNASSVARHTFAFVAFGTVFVFVVEAAQVYAFPTIVETTRSVPVVTLGAELVLTSTFSASLPSGMTASAVVTPTGQAPLNVACGVSGTTASVAHTVLYDVAHSALLTLAYGSTSAEYAWGAGTLTTAHIYTFPSTFAYSTNSFGTGLSVRQGISSSLTLTVSGGDMLHSSTVAAQVEYVRYAQGATVTDASVVACSDPLETIDVTVVPQYSTDLTLRVKLRGPDGTLSAEIVRVVPSAEIAPDWLPTAIASVGSDVPAPHKLVVGSAARLAFEFTSNGDLSSSALAEFSLLVDGVATSLSGASVSGRTLSVSYAAATIASRTFELRARGQSVVAVIVSNEVYAFPSVVSTAKSAAVVTLGTAVALTTTFGSSLPAAMTATMSVTPSGHPPSFVSATPSGNSATASYTVLSDVAHAAVITLAYGPASHVYAWSSSALSTEEIYTFPSSFTTSGLLQHMTSRALTLTFTGGDGLHSSVVASQISYVKYAQQGAAEISVPESVLSCSASAGTVLIVSLAPSLLADVTLKVALRAPDGAVGPEITSTMVNIQPQWVPTAAGSISSNVPAPHKLVVGSEVQLTFGFVSGADFPSTDASTLFTLRIDGAATALTSAVVNATARTVRVAYTAASAVTVLLEFSTSYGTSYAFSVSAAEVYTFPTMSSTTRGVSVVSLGQTLALTSLFSAALQSGTTASVSIVPTGYAPATPLASVSGSSVTYSVSVAYDVVHTGTVTLTYGAAQRAYSWAAGTLTAAHIYTFPSAFSYSGTSNGYGTGIHLKQSTAGALTLTFAGGDLLHSSVVSTQVEYVKFAQGGVETTIGSALLACSDPLETVTVASITPASTADLMLKVKLRGPDGALSSEITATMPSAQIMGGITGGITVRYIKIVTSKEIWWGKTGLYTSSAEAAADSGASTLNVIYAARATGAIITAGNSMVNGTPASIFGLTTWAAQDASNYIWLRDASAYHATLDLGASYATSEGSGLFFRLGVVGTGSSDSTPIRLRCYVSADNVTFVERKLSWTTDRVYTADVDLWHSLASPYHAYAQMIPTSFYMAPA